MKKSNSIITNILNVFVSNSLDCHRNRWRNLLLILIILVAFPSFAFANTTPVASDGSLTTLEGTVGTGTLSASDADGDPLTYTLVTTGTKGTAFILDPATGSYRYVPNADANGSDSITFKVNDGTEDSNTATISVTITAVNDAPSFTPGANQACKQNDSAQTITNWAAAMSAGPADESGQTLTFSVTAADTSLFSTQPAISAAGTLTFTPATDASGATDVTVTLQDDGGTASGGVNVSASKTFTIIIIPTPQIWFKADSVTGVNDGGDLGSWLDNSGNSRTASQADAAKKPKWYATGMNGKPVVRFDGTDDQLRTGNVNLAGTSDDVTIMVVTKPASTQSTGAAILDYNGQHDIYRLSQYGSGNNFGLSWYDYSIPGWRNNTTSDATPLNPNSGQILTTRKCGNSLTLYQNRKLVLTRSVNDPVGLVDNPSDLLVLGSIRALNRPYNGDIAEILIYNRGLSDTECQQIESYLVDKYSLPPVHDLQVWLKADSVTGVASGDPLTTWNDNSGNGRNATQSTTNRKPLYIANSLNGQPVIRFDGENDRLATSSFNFHGASDDMSLLTVTKPDASQPHYDATIVSFATNDNPTWMFYRFSDNKQYKLNWYDGTVWRNWSDTVPLASAQASSASIRKGGNQFLMRQNGNNVGNPITLSNPLAMNKISSPLGIGNSPYFERPMKGDIAEVLIYNVALSDQENQDAERYLQRKYALSTNLNHMPVANANSDTTQEDHPCTTSVLANDTGLQDGNLTVTVTTAPTHGTTRINPDNTITYTPAANYNGTDTYQYQVQDGDQESSTATVTITISAVNDAPVAVADSHTILEDGTLTVALPGVLGNDTDVEGSTLTAIKVTDPENGSLTLNADGSFTYTPDADWNGTDSFTYKANDGTDDSAPATVTITVTAVNDAPSFSPNSDPSVADNSGAQTFYRWAGLISPGPSDEYEQSITFTVTNNHPEYFDVQPAINSEGALTFTPKAGMEGIAALAITMHDNGGVANGGADTYVDNTATIEICKTPKFELLTPSAGEEFANSMQVELGVEVTDAPHGVQRVEFYVDGVKVDETDMAPYCALWQGNTNGQHTIKSKVIDEDGNGYDGPEITINIVPPAPGTVTTNTYYDYSSDPCGRVTSITSSVGRPVTFEYFDNSQVKKVHYVKPGSTNGDTVTTEFTYDTLGNLKTVLNPGDTNPVTYNYPPDTIGPPTSAVNQLGHTVSCSYDVRGNVTTSFDTQGRKATYTRNDSDQVTRVDYRASDLSPIDSSVTFTYLCPGGPLLSASALNANGQVVHTVEYTYDCVGNLLTTDGSSEKVTMAFDAMDRLQGITDGRDNATQYTLNGENELERSAYPNATGADYDAFTITSRRDDGRVLGFRDGNSVTGTLDYDNDYDLLSDYSYGGIGIHYTYDSWQRPTTVEKDELGSTDIAYDDAGNPLTVTTNYTSLSPLTAGFTYDDDGKVLTMSTPAGAFTYGYDTSGRLTSIIDPRGRTTTWVYQADGAISSQTVNDGSTDVAVTTYGYDAMGRLTSLTNVGSGVTLSVFSNFVYDAKDNLLSYDANYGLNHPLNGTYSFTYDAKNQLTQESSTRQGAITQNFAYDDAGNATTFRNFTIPTQNDDNQIDETGFVYDGNGNPTSYGGETLTYDAQDHLTAYGAVATYGYTAGGKRAWKEVDEVRTYYWYAGDTPVCEVQKIDDETVVTALNIFGAAGLLSRTEFTYDEEGQQTGESDVLYQFDPLGNAGHRLDEDGSLLTTQIFDSYGQELAAYDAQRDLLSPNTVPGPFGYKAQFGYYTDAETGLILCTHRYYDPERGRWLTRDPIGYDGGINLYGYCGNDPVGGVDPSGLTDNPYDGPCPSWYPEPTRWDETRALYDQGLPNDPEIVALRAQAYDDLDAWYMQMMPILNIYANLTKFAISMQDGEYDRAKWDLVYTGLSAAELGYFAKLAGLGIDAAQGALKSKSLVTSVYKQYRNGRKAFNSTGLSNAARELSKHPGLVGLKQLTGSKAVQNGIASKFLKNIMRNGRRVVRYHARHKEIIEYVLPDGTGARFSATTHEFLGFIGGGKAGL